MDTKIFRSAWEISESPYASFFRNDDVPSTTTLADLKMFLKGAQREFTNLENEISVLQNKLEDLVSERERARNYISTHQSFMSPLRRLPVETLTEIFFHCLPTERYPVRTMKEAPLILTSISRGWRQVAISSPELWSSIHVYIPWMESLDKIALREYGLALWLSRSGSLPLSISLALDGQFSFVSDWDNALITPFFRMLMSHSHRFQEVILAVDDRCFKILDSFSPRGFPTLTGFSVHSSISSSEPPLYFGSWLSKSPSLKRLSIETFDISPIDDYLALGCNWNNLTELVLEISRLSVSSLLVLLDKTHHLQSCLAKVVLEQMDNNLQLEPQLPHLHTMSIILYITGDHFDLPGEVVAMDAAQAIATFAFPSVEVFSVVWEQYPIRNVCFSASLEQLKELRLEVTMMPDTLSAYLSFMPNLSTLEIIDMGCSISGTLSTMCTVQDSVIDALSGAGPEPVPSLCPELTTFTLIMASYQGMEQSISIDSFLEFLEHKCWRLQAGVKKMERCDVVLPYAPSFSDIALKKLEKLQQDGLKLSIRHIAHRSFPPALPPDEPERGGPWAYRTYSLKPSWAQIQQTLRRIWNQGFEAIDSF